MYNTEISQTSVTPQIPPCTFLMANIPPHFLTSTDATTNAVNPRYLHYQTRPLDHGLALGVNVFYYS